MKQSLVKRQCLRMKTLIEKKSSPRAVKLCWPSQPGCDRTIRERRCLTGGHTTRDGRRVQPSLPMSWPVCNFQSIKGPVELNSLSFVMLPFVTFCIYYLPAYLCVCLILQLKSRLYNALIVMMQSMSNTNILTHFIPLVSFYTRWKYQKTKTSRKTWDYLRDQPC